MRIPFVRGGDTGTRIANDGIEELDAVFEGETESPGIRSRILRILQVDPTDGTDDASIEMDVDWEKIHVPIPLRRDGDDPGHGRWDSGSCLSGCSPRGCDGCVCVRWDVRPSGAVDEWGEVWWEVSVGKGELTGGSDANGDGWPDAGIILAESESGQSCGESGIGESRLVIVDPGSGKLSEPLTATADHCQEFEEEGGSSRCDSSVEYVEVSCLERTRAC